MNELLFKLTIRFFKYGNNTIRKKNDYKDRT